MLVICTFEMRNDGIISHNLKVLYMTCQGWPLCRALSAQNVLCALRGLDFHFLGSWWGWIWPGLESWGLWFNHDMHFQCFLWTVDWAILRCSMAKHLEPLHWLFYTPHNTLLFYHAVRRQTYFLLRPSTDLLFHILKYQSHTDLLHIQRP